MRFTGFTSLVSCFITPGSWLPSFNGDLVVRVPSYLLDCTISGSPSLCLWIPTGQRHEAVESCGYLRQTRLCQAGVFGSAYSHRRLILIIYFEEHVFLFPVKLFWSDRTPFSSAERWARWAAPGGVRGRQDHHWGLQAVGRSSWIRTGLQVIHVSKRIQAGCRKILIQAACYLISN